METEGEVAFPSVQRFSFFHLLRDFATRKAEENHCEINKLAHSFANFASKELSISVKACLPTRNNVPHCKIFLEKSSCIS
jgi:hypothetical protein